jgi:hypothetical protein
LLQCPACRVHLDIEVQLNICTTGIPSSAEVATTVVAPPVQPVVDEAVVLPPVLYIAAKAMADGPARAKRLLLRSPPLVRPHVASPVVNPDAAGASRVAIGKQWPKAAVSFRAPLPPPPLAPGRGSEASGSSRPHVFEADPDVNMPGESSPAKSNTSPAEDVPPIEGNRSNSPSPSPVVKRRRDRRPR